MFLKIGGNTKVPTQVVMNEFRKRGMDISLEQLQNMFPAGNNFIKNITNQVVEFNTTDQQEVPGTVKKSQDNKAAVSNMALKAVRKRD